MKQKRNIFFWLDTRSIIYLGCTNNCLFSFTYEQLNLIYLWNGLFLWQLVENDKLRNANREALTALRRKARTTKTSVPTPFESVMKEVEGAQMKPLVKEICATCGNHDSAEKTWMSFPGSDIFASVPFHAAHTILEKGKWFTLYFETMVQFFIWWCKIQICFICERTHLSNLGRKLFMVKRYAITIEIL